MMLYAKDGDAKPPARRPRGRPTAEDAALIDERLLDVALQQFLAHGYGGTSLTQIVKAAGISKTTLYSRFASKDALFRALITRQTDRLAAVAVLRSPRGRPDLLSGLKAYGNRTLEISFEGELLELNRLIQSESTRFPELGEAGAERSRLGIAQVAEFIRHCAVEDGVPCRAPEAVAQVFIFMLKGWYLDHMLANRSIAVRQREAWVDKAVRTLIAGREGW